MHARTADIDDAPGLSRVLREIIEQTGRDRPNDEAYVLRTYIANPTGVRCTVAVGPPGEILGFQSLIRAVAGNPYDVPAGWGVIGSHVSPRAHRQGVGTALFQSSLEAARNAGLEKIDAYIRADNPGALAYYQALGFRTYRTRDGVVQKVYSVSGP